MARIYRNIYYGVIIVLLSVGILQLRAENAVEDYDSLSRLSSAQLLETGRYYFEKRIPSRALACFSIVAERYRKDMDHDEARVCIRAMNNNGCVYKFFYFNYSQAYECFSQALDLCEEHGYDEFAPVVLVNLGDLLSDYSNNFDSSPLALQAAQFFEQCIASAVEKQNWEVLTTAFFNLANQNYELDLTKYEVLFSPDIPDDTPDLEYVRLQYRGIERLQQGDIAGARECFERQLAVVNTIWEPERDTLATLMNIAYTYEKERDYERSANYLLQAYDMAETRQLTDHSAAICRQLSECYHFMGDADRQNRFRMLYLEKREKEQDSRLASIGELNYVHELQKEQQRAAEMTYRQRQQQYALLVTVLLLSVILGSALLLWRKNRELLARNKALFEKTQIVMKVEADEQLKRRNRHSAPGRSAVSPPPPQPAAPQAPAAPSQPGAPPPSERSAVSPPPQPQPGSSTSGQSSEQRLLLIQRIEEILDQPEVFCQQDFTVARLAKLVESNTTYVSQAINERYANSFSTVLGTCRIREACRRMNDQEHYGHITIEGISSGVGFKSRTAFTNAFKREIGLTPSEYLRMAVEQSRKS